MTRTLTRAAINASNIYKIVFTVMLLVELVRFGVRNHAADRYQNPPRRGR